MQDKLLLSMEGKIFFLYGCDGRKTYCERLDGQVNTKDEGIDSRVQQF